MTKHKLLDRNGRAAVSIKPKQSKSLYSGVIRFDHAPDRICNASMREPLVLVRQAPARKGAADASALPSIGQGC